MEEIIKCPICGAEIAWHNCEIGGHICSSDFVEIGKPCRCCQEEQKQIIENNRLENDECY